MFLWVVVSKYILKFTSAFGILASMLIATGINNLDFYTVNKAIGAAGFNIKNTYQYQCIKTF